MQAVCLTSFNGIAGLELRNSLPIPVPGRDEVLVEVHTVGANQLDLNTMPGRGPGGQTRLPLIPGIDPAGVVVAQGVEVVGRRIGERVVAKPNISCGQCSRCTAGRAADCPDQTILGAHRHGGAAQYTTVPARNAFAIGDLDFAMATAAIHSVPIALHAIEAAGGLDVDDTVLVTGATGAVGSAAVQIARHRGAKVLAASTSHSVEGENIRPVRYDNPDELARSVLDLCPEGVDLVVDGTGHGAVMAAAARCLGWCGRMVVCSASLSSDLALDARALYLRRQTVLGVGSADYGEVEEAVQLVRSGVVKPLVDARFPLADTRRAYEAISDRSRHGKVVIDLR